MRSNSTITKPAAATAPRRKPPIYQMATELRQAFESADPNARAMLTARIFAMAEHLSRTPAGAMLTELLYVACGKAWKHNRQNISITTTDAIFFEDDTVTLNGEMLGLIKFLRGEREDDELQQELDHRAQLKRQSHVPTVSRVVNIDEWKAVTYRRNVLNTNG